jgi:RsiW-degrading membrane proteinase PrsW (M82 family)
MSPDPHRHLSVQQIQGEPAMTTTLSRTTADVLPATSIQEPARLHRRSRRLSWLWVLLTGIALFGVVLAVLLSTGNPIYIPCLLLLGAAVVPATMTTLIYGIEGWARISLARLLTGAVLGAVIGGVLAGLLEFETARALGGSLPTPMIGLIEETAKLAIPALLLIRWRPRPRAVEGLVLGVAVGSGFAAMETMGYGFVQLINSQGNLEPVAQLLALRGVTSLGGHAAWTGLACAALFAIAGSRRRWLGWLRFAAVFAGVVALHAIWDSSATGTGYLEVGAVSFVLLLAAAVGLHLRARAAARRAAQVSVVGTPTG